MSIRNASSATLITLLFAVIYKVLPEVHLSWGDVAAADDALQAIVHLPLDGRLAGHRVGSVAWATNSGHMAAITLQRAYRIALPLTDLVALP